MSRTRELIDADLAEQLMASAAERGQSIPNAGMHASLPDALLVFQNVVQPELDARFEAFVTRSQAETHDRIAVRRRALVRHFETKIETLRDNKIALNERAFLAEHSGETRRARNLRNLVLAREVTIERLSRTRQLRESEMEAQREMTPVASDVGCVLLQVEGGPVGKQ